MPPFDELGYMSYCNSTANLLFQVFNERHAKCRSLVPTKESARQPGFRLIELRALTDTLVADADSVHNPAEFKGRILLSMKRTISETGLHVQGAPARKNPQRGLPPKVPLPSDSRFRPGRARRRSPLPSRKEVVRAIRNVFEHFAELDSMRRV